MSTKLDGTSPVVLSNMKAIISLGITGLVVTAGAWFLPERSVSATAVMYLSDEDLAREADLVVLGSIIDVNVVTYPVSPGIFSEVRVAVYEHLRAGKVLPSDILLRIPGGAMDDRRVDVLGMPRFYEGETVLLFLEALPLGAFGDAEPAYIPLGLNQGVWKPQADGLHWARGAQVGLFTPAPFHGSLSARRYSTDTRKSGLSAFSPSLVGASPSSSSRLTLSELRSLVVSVSNRSRGHR